MTSIQIGSWYKKACITTVLLLLILVFVDAKGAVTKVGNGDDGRDLEGFEQIKDGRIADSRKKAVELLNRLNIAGVRGLGTLLPETEKSEFYLAKKDVEAIEGDDQSKFHSNMQGLVFARTFAEPHAPTRFFPISLQLDENQLVSLQIHEALHRALPDSIRENEEIVSQFTIAITSPGATFDRIVSVADKHILKPVEYVAHSYDEGKSVVTQPNIPEDAEIKRPSMFRYGYRAFNKSEDSETLSSLKSMHTLESYLYPFGSDANPIGIGIGLSIASMAEKSQLGPLSLSGRGRIWSARGFDIGLWGELALNTLSNEELKNSAYGRDVVTLGLSMRKDANYYYIENLLGLSLPGTIDQKIGNINYKYEFGALTTAKVRAGGRYKGFAIGGFGEILLSDYFKSSGGEHSYDSGRFNIVSAGPEASFTMSDLTLTLYGRFILSRTNDATYDTVGNLMGVGVGEGFVGASLALNL